MAITKKPKKRKRKRKHGFLQRSSTTSGKNVLKRRRTKGRQKLTVQFQLMLPKENRLKKKKDFEKLFKEGKSFSEKFLVLKINKNNLNNNRFGFIVSKKISKKAVTRNKIKRQLREIVRKEINNYQKGFDVAVIALPDIESKNFEEISQALECILKKIKILNYDQ